MSTDWSVWCLDCKSEYEPDQCHAPERVVRLIAAAPALAAFGLATNGMALSYDDCGFEVLCPLSYNERRIDLAWFAEHGAHRLIPRSEYGDCFDECAERFKCACCPNWLLCHRTKGHDGEHGQVRDDAKEGAR